MLSEKCDLSKVPTVYRLPFTAYPRSNETTMELLHKWLPTFWAFMNESRVIGGLIIVVTFGIAARIADLILVRVLLSLAH